MTLIVIIFIFFLIFLFDPYNFFERNFFDKCSENKRQQKEQLSCLDVQKKIDELIKILRDAKNN